ncbi:amino acid/polyamine transporter I [Microdochium bolleyi]|uniref:Amino acid/polyamine transporter I n=1 Tax=Microdochium bolleyi TaxID=196109 RepID=A0A136IKD5_9PEZI|nr:amino acid/polyamine transporter I [Microdochium bolleyi]
MPTALGQAYWVNHLLQDKSWGRILSYACAWINTFGWWTLSASQLAFMNSFACSMKTLFDNEFVATGWMQFLVYLGFTALLTGVNAVACRRDSFLPFFNNFVGVGFVALFLVFVLAMLISVGIKEDLEFQPPSFVFGAWINNNGWPDGVTWFIGLVQAAYGLTAFDAAVHMVEEVPNPRKTIPRVLWLAVLLGATTGFIFMVACLFSIQSLDDVLSPTTGLPFMDLVAKSVGLEGGAVLLSLFIFNGLSQGVSVLTTGSRMTWGFARDGGLPYSTYFSHVDPVWRVPLRALVLQGVLIGLVGVLYTFADTVLTAILSVSTIALTISYALPIVALLVAGRDKLPPGGTFKLGKFGPFANYVSLVYCAITTVFFFFPGSPDPAPEDMNYAIAVFGIVLVVAVVFWFVRGRVEFLQIDGAMDRAIVARRVEGEAASVGSNGAGAVAGGGSVGGTMSKSGKN